MPKKKTTKKKAVKKKAASGIKKKTGKNKGIVKYAEPPKPVEVLGVYNLPIPEKLKKKENPTWNRNHELILYHALDYSNKHLRFPSSVTLEKLTGISKLTIQKHLKEFNLDRRKSKYKVMLDSVIPRLIKSALDNGQTDSVKLLLKYVAGWSETIEVNQNVFVDFRVSIDKISKEKNAINQNNDFVKHLLQQNNSRKFTGSN
jgi:hypothetical protein